MGFFYDHEREFKDYYTSDSPPFEVLKEPSQRKIVCSILSQNGRVEEDLFGQENLEDVVDRLFDLNQRKIPLYNRWVKREGNKKRSLSVPKKELRKLLEYFREFVKRKDVHENCHGGESSWSPRKSLETHLPCNCAFSFDLESAFENLTIEKVFGLVYEMLDGLNYEDRRNISGFFATICTIDYDGKRGLPQGSPISMALFNRIFYPLDELLFQKSDERRIHYSRWVDDLTLTSTDEKGIEEFMGAVDLATGYFPVARGKMFFQKEGIIYLLGHKIIDNVVLKNTKEEKLMNKSPPVNYDDWFGENKTKNYEPW